MKSLRTVIFLLFLGTGFAASPASSPNPNSIMSGRSRPQGSMVDWALNKINPQDIDYGQRIEDARQKAFNSTVHDYGFWSEFVAVCVLGMMFLIVFWQDGKHRRLLFSTARVVTAYHNELAVARDQITRLSSEYALAKRILGEHMEAIPVVRPQAARRENANGKDSVMPNGQPSRDQLMAENNSLKQQVKTLTTKWQEEQQKNRKLKGE